MTMVDDTIHSRVLWGSTDLPSKSPARYILLDEITFRAALRPAELLRDTANRWTGWLPRSNMFQKPLRIKPRNQHGQILPSYYPAWAETTAV